jgi:hypothetical protein
VSTSAPPAQAAQVIAPGVRAAWLRGALIVLALIYYVALIHNWPDVRPLRAIRYFTEATALFPKANVISQDFELEAWTCDGKWAPLDPRPYFPLRPDDKESRFQRLGYFYNRSRPVMQALDDYIRARHAEGGDDGVTGKIGGIRLVRVARPLPAPGEPVARYAFDPLAPVPASQRRDLYFTPASVRKARCTSP